jgi:hypothetical protein
MSPNRRGRINSITQNFNRQQQTRRVGDNLISLRSSITRAASPRREAVASQIKTITNANTTFKNFNNLSSIKPVIQNPVIPQNENNSAKSSICTGFLCQVKNIFGFRGGKYTRKHNNRNRVKRNYSKRN